MAISVFKIFSCEREDPFIRMIREELKATPLGVPNANIQPLEAIAYKGKVADFIGKIDGLLAGAETLKLDTEISEVPDIQRNKSNSINMEAGIGLLEGILKGFTGSNLGLKGSFQKEGVLSFSFPDLQQRRIDIASLGKALKERRLDFELPTMHMFDHTNSFPHELLLITTVYASKTFSINVEKISGNNGELDFSVLESQLGEVKGKLNISKTSDRSWTFEGSEALTIAFSSIQLNFTQEGKILFKGIVQPETARGGFVRENNLSDRDEIVFNIEEESLLDKRMPAFLMPME